MSRKIEWNPEHKNPDEQQNEFVDRFLSWTPAEKWDYLMKLAEQGRPKPVKKGKRRIEWK